MCTPWIITIGFLVAANCSLVGTFLMLRKKSMIGDVISHGVLLGVVVIFFITGRKTLIFFLLGALFSAMIMMWLISLLEHIRVDKEAAMGIIFTSFFALGVLLISVYTKRVDLDQGCVLYGQIITALFDRIGIMEKLLPRAVVTLGVLLAINLSIIFLNYNRIRMISFDPNWAISVGINVKLWYCIFILLTSCTCVLSFKIVGVPLVVTFLILPSATAYLISNELTIMLGYTLIIDILIALFGYTVAVIFKASIPGGMASVSSIFFGSAYIVQLLNKRQKLKKIEIID